jgi:Na+/H+-dicarboxylate symporter
MTVQTPIPDFATARAAMVENQLRPQGVTDPAVLHAMGSVEREKFLPSHTRPVAYVDRAVAMGEGRFLAAPAVLGILVTLAAYPLGVLVARVPSGRFLRGMIGPGAVAISTRSSIASLPAMLTAARTIGVREEVADVTLPISVALFRATGPAMNTAVAFYVAHWLGLEPTLAQMIAATAVGAVMSYGAVSLPGEVSYISSIAPIALALGVPIAPLGLLVAVEMIPDIFRTVGNVAMDVTLATIVDRQVPAASKS